MIEAMGLSYPVVFITLAKLIAVVGVVFYLADQVFGEDETWDD